MRTSLFQSFILTGQQLLLLDYFIISPARALPVHNPSFENNFDGWEEIEPVSISTSNVVSGVRAAKITGSGGRIKQDVAVNVNTDYRLTAWILGKGTLGIDLGDGGEISQSGSHDTYTLMTVDFNTGAATTVNIFGAYNGGTGRFDDFNLEALTDDGPTLAPTTPPSLSNLEPITLTNPSFESSFDGWVEVEPVSISTSNVVTGTRAAKITGTDGRIEQTVAVNVDTNYRLTAWILGQGTLGIDLNNGGSDVTKSGSYGTYTLVTVDFNSGSATAVTLFGAYNGGTGRFDDFALIPLQDVSAMPISAPTTSTPAPVIVPAPTPAPIASPTPAPIASPTPEPVPGPSPAPVTAPASNAPEHAPIDAPVPATTAAPGPNPAPAPTLQPPSSPEPTITLINSDFESNFNGWVEIEPVAISTSNVMSGSRAAKITGSGGRFEQAVALTANSNYSLSAWILGHGTLGVDIEGSKVTQSGNYDVYTLVTVNFNTGPAAAVTIFGSYNGGTGRFDDFALVKLQDGTNVPTLVPMPVPVPMPMPVPTPTPAPIPPTTSVPISAPISTSTPTSQGNSCSTMEQLFVKAVTASADDGNIPANTLDNNLGTRWSAEGNGQWIRFDLGEEVNITEMEIAWYEGNQRVASFDIETSLDLSVWTLVYAGASSGSITAPEYYDVVDSAARYVRIVGYGNTLNNWNSVTEVDIFGCGQTGVGDDKNGLDPTLPPGSNFDLSTWKITFPNASEEKEAWLTGGGERLNEFYTDPVTGGMVFRCPNLAGSTGGSSYSRTELREMLRAGDTSISTTGLGKNNWVFSTSSSTNQIKAGGVDGTLKAKLTVDHVSTTGDANKVGRVIIGQIHASNDEPIRLYYRKLPDNSKGSIYFAHEPTTGSEQWYNMIGSRSDSASDPISDGIGLGEAFNYVIDVRGNTLTVTIQREGKADIIQSVNMSNSGFADDWMYFKAGVYNQNNTGSSSDYVQATFYILSTTHN